MARTIQSLSKRARISKDVGATPSDGDSSPPSKSVRTSRTDPLKTSAVESKGAADTKKHLQRAPFVKSFLNYDAEDVAGDGSSDDDDERNQDLEDDDDEEEEDRDTDFSSHQEHKSGRSTAPKTNDSLQNDVDAIFAMSKPVKRATILATSVQQTTQNEKAPIPHQPEQNPAQAIKTTMFEHVAERTIMAGQGDKGIDDMLRRIDPAILMQHIMKMFQADERAAAPVAQEEIGETHGERPVGDVALQGDAQLGEISIGPQVDQDDGAAEFHIDLDDDTDEEKEKQMEMEERAEELCAALAAPFENIYRMQSAYLSDGLFVQMQDSLGKAVQPFEAEVLNKQLVLWLDAESAYKKKDQALWAEMRKSHEADNAKMAHVLSKINAAHHLKRKLVKEAEGECAKLLAKQTNELNELTAELQAARVKATAALAKVTDKKSRTKDQQNAMQKVVASMSI